MLTSPLFLNTRFATQFFVHRPVVSTIAPSFHIENIEPTTKHQKISISTNYSIRILFFFLSIYAPTNIFNLSEIHTMKNTNKTARTIKTPEPSSKTFELVLTLIVVVYAMNTEPHTHSARIDFSTPFFFLFFAGAVE